MYDWSQLGLLARNEDPSSLRSLHLSGLIVIRIAQRREEAKSAKLTNALTRQYRWEVRRARLQRASKLDGRRSRAFFKLEIRVALCIKMRRAELPRVAYSLLNAFNKSFHKNWLRGFVQDASVPDNITP
ncbi:MAG TPA: hypothetical protein VH370_02595 [Humisphaera sp.]|jgi:hypothetical protein|nr:hypothetical protein [Humisphaera sp.]